MMSGDSTLSDHIHIVPRKFTYRLLRSYAVIGEVVDIWEVWRIGEAGGESLCLGDQQSKR